MRYAVYSVEDCVTGSQFLREVGYSTIGSHVWTNAATNVSLLTYTSQSHGVVEFNATVYDLTGLTLSSSFAVQLPSKIANPAQTSTAKRIQQFQSDRAAIVTEHEAAQSAVFAVVLLGMIGALAAILQHDLCCRRDHLAKDVALSFFVEAFECVYAFKSYK